MAHTLDSARHPAIDGARRRYGARTLLAPAALAALLAFGPASVDAATLTGAWQATVGSAGVNGTAKIQIFDGGTGSLTLRLAKLRPATSLPVTLSRGTCSSVGSTLIKFPAIRTTSAGAAARTASLTSGQVGLITGATRDGGAVAIRIGASSTGGVKCGVFAPLIVPPRVAAQIPVGRYPADVAVTPNGVVVANAYDRTLTRIDPASNNVLANVQLTATQSFAPVAVAYGEAGLWVAIATFDAAGAEAAGQVQRLDPASYQVLATVTVGKEPFEIAVGPGAVWVTNYVDGSVSRIDPATNQVVATIPVGDGPVGIAADGGTVWVANERTGTVSRIDPATNEVVATIITVGAPGGVTTGGGAVWVTNWGSTGQPDGILSRIDPATNQVVKTIPVGTNPGLLAFGGGFVWVGMQGEPTVVQVNASTNAVQARLQVGGALTWGLEATDHTVWSVQPAAQTDQTSPPQAGTLTRIDY